MALAALMAAACGGAADMSERPSGGGSSRTAPATAAASSPTVVEAGRAQLYVLGADAAGHRGLWAFAAPDRWWQVAGAATATALARFGDAVAVAGPGYVEIVRPGGAGEATPAALPLAWPSGAAGAAVVDFDRSPGGRIVLVAATDADPAYFLAEPGLKVAPLNPAPVQPLTPAVAWLDDSRLLAISTDAAEVSRVVEIVPGAASYVQTSSVSGVRDLAVSGDRATVALATATRIFAGDVPALFGKGSLAEVAAVPDGSVAWGLALDDDGAALAFLEGAVGPDGIVGDVHLRTFARAGDGWTPVRDAAVQLSTALDVVWAPAR